MTSTPLFPAIHFPFTGKQKQKRVKERKRMNGRIQLLTAFKSAEKKRRGELEREPRNQQ